LGLRIQRIEGEWIRRRLYLAMRDRTQLSMAAQAFVALINELIPPDSRMRLAV
jgi:hypothetical protein